MALLAGNPAPEVALTIRLRDFSSAALRNFAASASTLGFYSRRAVTMGVNTSG